jgi:glycosyltransferase involved in cell wall biosynthesis
MRIGVISSTKGRAWGVTDEIWARMVSRALASGHEIYVAADRQIVHSRRLSQLTGPRCLAISRRPFRPTRIYHLKERLFSELRPLERFGPQAILVSVGAILDLFYQPSLLFFLRRSSSSIVLLCHGHSDLYQIPKREELASLLAGVHSIVFVSKANRFSLETQLATRLRNSYVVHNEPTFTAPMDTPVQDEPTAFAIVARLESFWKGHDILFRALSGELWRQRQWTLQVCGAGPDLAHLRRLATLFKLDERITFRGHVDDIRGVWRECCALLLPSRAEGLSVAVLEAMVCSRVVVTTDVGGHSEIIADGENGFLAECASVNSYGKALERAWSLRADWPRIGSAARDTSLKLANANPAGRLLEIVLDAARGAHR